MNWNHAFQVGYFSLYSSSRSLILVFSLMNCTEVWRWRVRLASVPWSLSCPCHEPLSWRTVRRSRCIDWPPRRRSNCWRTRKWQVGSLCCCCWKGSHKIKKKAIINVSDSTAITSSVQKDWTKANAKLMSIPDWFSGSATCYSWEKL